MIERIVAVALIPAWITCTGGFLFWVAVHKACGNDAECAHA